MYRLLIVDDEAFITDGMAEILGRLDSPKLDICKAYSGEEALEWLNGTRIDIVLTDVRMPGINGLELMETIRRNWPRCRIIFLTGYNDFDAVYQAIQTWGVRYLLKTEGYGKVKAEVLEAVRELDEGMRTNHLLEQAREQRNTLETLAHGDYFRQLLAGSGMGSEEVRAEDCRKLNIPLDSYLPVLPVLGSLMQAQGGALTSYADRQEAAMAVKLLGDSYLRGMIACVGIIDRYGDVLWLVQPTGAVEPDAGHAGTVRYLEGMLELIQEACSKSLGIGAAFTIGSAMVPWESLPLAYDRLRQLQHVRVGDGTSMVMTAGSLEAELDEPVRERIRGEKLELLAGHLEGGREDAFMELLQELSEPVLGGRMLHAGQVMELYYSMAIILLSYMNQRQSDLLATTQALMRFDAHASWQEAFDYLSRTAESLFKLRQQGERSRAAGAMAAIRAYIEEHLAEDLSLVRLARQSHFNPSYLSRLFKQETGQNLSEYIDEARAKKARELLANEEWKIHEVGARVGYDAPHSFTRFFKKMTSVTPQEYRDAVRNSAN